MVSSFTWPTAADDITFTATVTGTGAVPQGTVTFYEEGTSIGTGSLASTATTPANTAVATLDWGEQSPGSYEITADYSGATASAASSSLTAFTQTVYGEGNIALTVSMFQPPDSSSVTFTVSSGSDSLTGQTATFLDGSTCIGTGTFSASGKATLTTSSLTGGEHSISALYIDTEDNESISDPGEEVEQTTVTTSSSSSTVGQTVTFTATVAGVSNPTGTVTFMDGATPLGTALIHSQGTQGTATFSTTKLTAGNNTMTAIYSGDGTSTNKASTSGPLEVQAYKTGPLLTVTSSADLVEQGATVTYTATVTNGSSTSGTVTFLDGGTSIGTGSISNGVATYSANGLSGGTHSITAVYTDGTNWVASVSKTFRERVQQAIPASVGSSDQTQFFVGTDSADDGESEGDGWTDAPWSAGRNSNSGSAPVFDDLMYRGQSVQWNDGVYRGEPVKMQLLGNQGGQATAAKGNTMPPGQESVPRTERPARDGIVVPNLSTQLQSLTNSAKNIVHNVGTTLRQVNDAVVADQVAALTHDTRPEFVKKIKAAVGQLGILEQQQLLRILRREHLTPSAGEALGRILSGSLHDNEAKPEQMAVEIRAALAKLARQRLPDTTPEDHVARRLADYTASVSDDNDIDVLEARYLQIVRELEEKEPKSWEKLAQLFKGDNPDGDTFLDDIHKKTGVTIFDVGTLKHYLATWEKGDKDSSKIANDTGGQTPEPEPPPDNDTGGQTPEQEPPPFPERYPTTNLDQPPPKPPETPPIHTTKTQTQEDRNYQDLIRNIPKWINEVKTEKAASDKAVAARRTNAEARMKEIEDAQKWATQYKGIWSGQLERLRPNRKVLGSEWLASSPEIDIGLDGKITFYNAYKKDQDWDENNPPEAPARELRKK